MKDSTKGPLRWGYLVGASLIVAAFVGCAVLLVILIYGFVPDTRFAAPGTHEVHLKNRGEYTVFYEYLSVVDGKTYSTGSYPSSMSLQIGPTSSHRSVEMSSDSGSNSYRTPKYAGRSVFRFSVDEPGTYTIVSEYTDSSTGPEIVFAVAKRDGRSWALRGLSIIATAVIVFWIGVFVLVRTFVKRRNATKTASGLAP